MTQMHAVEKQLREMILAMDIGPGERLTERWAEGRSGTSRTSVRAALLRLEAEGLVCREGRGWMVTPINLEEVGQLFVYREVLEVAAVQLAATMADQAGAIDAMEALLDTCGPDATREQAHRVGHEFHVRLARLSGNEFIGRGVADAMTRLARARWLVSDPAHPGWTEHRAILAALREGNADEAVRLIEAHVRQSRDHLLVALEEGRRSFRARGVVVA
jgi:DNA-binding GntR family transcriptional regulator